MMTTDIRIDDDGLARDAQALKNISAGNYRLSADRIADVLQYQTSTKWGEQPQPDAFRGTFRLKLTEAQDFVAKLREDLEALASDIHKACVDAQFTDSEITKELSALERKMEAPNPNASWLTAQQSDLS